MENFVGDFCFFSQPLTGLLRAIIPLTDALTSTLNRNIG
ncbi:hypothetical protein M595_3793 [Lyngbya aestuarii BL J]|uniref:Uncharacterized protein n=1 Tax=Lyngbya aestuarii BL J TaxID=1348334 RepID=U7QG74_9CYAN|nr:hypothetical protein M595_3793 [Lyngbya aestuarii BL J]